MSTNADKPSSPATPAGTLAPAKPASAAAPESKGDFWRIAHRSLRGQYRFALIIAGGGAIAGAAIGTMLGQRLYSATGLVRIASVLPQVMHETDQNRPMAMFDGFIQAQRELMTSREIVDAALHEAPWQKVSKTRRVPNEERFAASLRVETRPRSDFLRVVFSSKDPVVSAAAVQSVISAYQAAFLKDQQHSEDQRLTQLQSRKATLSAELKTLEEKISQTGKGLDQADIEPLYAAAAERLKKLRGAMADVQVALAGGPDLTDRIGGPARSAAELVADEMLQSYAAESAKADTELAAAVARGCGPNHRTIIQLTAIAKECRERLSEYAQECEKRRASTETGASPLTLKEREQNLRKLTQGAEDEIKGLAAQRAELALLESQAATLRQNLSETDSRLDALATEATAGSRLTVVTSGDEPMTALLDNRAKVATVGMLMGFAAPTAGLIFFGALRRRYRFCDDVVSDLSGRVPFVAVLPDLDEAPALSPEAAHCVHDLRVRLQPAEPGRQRMYLIASATGGEGKTSIAMSLGLSFAAAGFRTLLIDAGLASRRVTTGFGVDDASGMLEAVGGEQPAIRKVRSGLSILPAGRAGRDDACRLAPAATGRVLAALRERFDVVLIDSDPVHNSLAAPVIAPHVDGVLLSLSRNQDQTLVQKAVKQFESLGASLACAVFNRAPASDFQARDTDENEAAAPSRVLAPKLNRFGPLVAATLGSLSLSREDDLELSPDGMTLARSDAPQRAVA